MTNEAEHDWKYDSKTELQNGDFFFFLLDSINEAEIVSIGEYHDLEQNSSFSWILDYSEDILEAARQHQRLLKSGKSRDDLSFQSFLPFDSDLMQKLDGVNSNLNELRSMHVGIFFAMRLLPIAAKLGFTDVIFEGLNDSNMLASYEFSKDKVGDLLRIVMATRLDMIIHGARSSKDLPSAVDVGQELKTKIDECKEEKPDARIIVYNGAMHNMTITYTAPFFYFPGVKLDTAKISYAPAMIEKYGARYVAIDLLNKNKAIPSSHFQLMTEEASSNQITMYKHGIRQKTFVID